MREAAVGSSRPHQASVIAIDGPAASGKSAVGSALAHQLGFRFFDTGAMYRALTWLALRRHVDPSNDGALARLAESVDVQVCEGDDSQEPTRVNLDGADATPHLRDPDVETNVSLVSRVPGVRSALVRIQRNLAASGNVIMAGRDIGSVVLPDADLKVYLDASHEVRAKRRAEQIRASGGAADEGSLLAELERRDRIDSSREASPLTKPPDAVIINTDGLSIEEVVQRIATLARG